MTIPKADWIWHQGKWCRWQDATVHITTHAMHYGSSVFEGIRCYETPDGPAIFRLPEHVRRLLESCRLLRMELGYDQEELESLCEELVIKNGQSSCYLRPLAYRGSGAMGLDPTGSPVELTIFSFEWGKYLGEGALEAGVDVGVSSWRRIDSGSLMPLGKIGGQYINNQQATVEAKMNGYSEAVFLDSRGQVTEGAGQNLFLVVGGELITPPTVDGILAGITRDTILTLAQDLHVPVRRASIPRDRLYLCDEIFMTGTASEITPVRSVDRIPVGEGKPGPITRRLQEAFFDIVTGKVPDRHGWLRSVRVPAPEPEPEPIAC